MSAFPVRVSDGRSRPTKHAQQHEDDVYDVYILDDAATLRVSHLTKHMHVDLHLTDILRGMRIWMRDAVGETADAWAMRARDQRMRMHHHAYPTTVAYRRDFVATVHPNAEVRVRVKGGGLVCRFNGAYAVHLAVQTIGPFAHERADDWLLRIDCATYDSDDESE